MAQTPMMNQYLKIKENYQDAILFFRLGDFYEMFHEDALVASKELEITLTGRGQGEDRIPMCGVPHHAAEGYQAKLIEKGYKVAICEQVEDPKMVKGVVKREVTKLLTPGTLMNSNLLAEKENNYLFAFATDGSNFGIARCDLSTGENDITLVTGDDSDLLHEIGTSEAREVIAPLSIEQRLKDKLSSNPAFLVSYQENVSDLSEYTYLTDNMKEPLIKEAYQHMLHYLLETQKQSIKHLQQPVTYHADSFLKMDVHAKRNLELVETLREKKKKGSLLSIIDQSVTSMGGRLLRQWLDRPLVNRKKIGERQSVVRSFLTHFFERESLRDSLKEVYDIERLAARIAYGSVNARELVQLKRSLNKLPEMKEQLTLIGLEQKWLNKSELFQALVEKLAGSLVEDPPISVTEGGLIIDGYSEELDTYRDASRNGKQWIAALEQSERELTNIRSLKVGYNKVFGYYIEVSRTNTHLLPEGRYERKQTLANAERYITPELKEKEALILEAEEKLTDLEYQLFTAIRAEIERYVPDLQALARDISEIDVLAGFAATAEQNGYVQPEVTETRDVEIKGGRHPVVETVIKRGSYVQNEINLIDNLNMLLITGPNMGGKSTYMRQLALTVVMTQIGSFVPADEAKLPVFDKIFTRIGAADDLASGQSTFMVEMMETKDALTKATANSLILLDEIGRGTSTYDGMALAQAIIEYIYESIGAKTLFSTHYHELTTLADSIPTLQNVHVSATEEDGAVVFLHRVIAGAADRSYGVYVAELAGLPPQVTSRAEQLLETLETGQRHVSQTTNTPELVKEEVAATSMHASTQLTLFQTEDVPEKKGRSKKEDAVLQSMSELDLWHLTPFQALEKINEWQKQLRKK
ncbi:DNA mismatch repair protein MutS [Alkalihalobacillus xiaoxiensis]|uniref:DNA mismatch repair protein MutS n=1 Tax=Shouchella xiaoxiensis TaxID=766895 RepID=A0ABS2SQD7_9BACI|nr:DNA mismatch repair protein MutS [Shouchella xiaoxiensis]MBM7837728.1 DNA mismatch repair protein MutS [Shouchella xiaoxiensis]